MVHQCPPFHITTIHQFTKKSCYFLKIQINSDLRGNIISSAKTSKRNLKLDDFLENTPSMEKFAKSQKKTTINAKSCENQYLIGTPYSQMSININKADPMKYSSLHSPRSENGKFWQWINNY